MKDFILASFIAASVFNTAEAAPDKQAAQPSQTTDLLSELEPVSRNQFLRQLAEQLHLLNLASTKTGSTRSAYRDNASEEPLDAAALRSLSSSELARRLTLVQKLEQAARKAKPLAGKRPLRLAEFKARLRNDSFSLVIPTLLTLKILQHFSSPYHAPSFKEFYGLALVGIVDLIFLHHFATPLLGSLQKSTDVDASAFWDRLVELDSKLPRSRKARMKWLARKMSELEVQEKTAVCSTLLGSAPAPRIRVKEQADASTEADGTAIYEAEQEAQQHRMRSRR